MSRALLVASAGSEVRAALVEDGTPVELIVERQNRASLVGNIYLGRVARVLPGMQSAFVDIGLERAAFLHVADIWEYRQFSQEKPPPIERPSAALVPRLALLAPDRRGPGPRPIADATRRDRLRDDQR